MLLNRWPANARAKEFLPTLKASPASSSKDAEIHPLLRICDAEEFIDEKTSSEDVKNSKPDPDILKAALKQIELPSNQTVLLGDTPYDLKAAQMAAIRFVGVRSGGWNDEELARSLGDLRGCP